MIVLRPLVMLAILVGACFLTDRHSIHHHAAMVPTEEGGQKLGDPSSVFTMLYFHVVPSRLVAAPEHPERPDDAGVVHDVVDGHDEWHEERATIFSVDLPDFLAAFDGDPTKEGAQFVLYNLQIFQLAALLMILVGFSGVPGYLRSGKADPITRMMAGFCLWVRDDLVEPAMGKELSDKLLPMMMFLFFFILFMNVMGLTPLSVTPTASIFVTAALAFITLSMMIIGGVRVQGPIDFLKNQVPHVPGFLWPLMFVIEVIGNLLIKPVALMIRLFATMTGGHLVVLSFLALIFFFASSYGSFGKTLSPVWVGFAVFIMIIEAFVALVQAYIFTLLSSLFIGAAVHPEH